MILHADASALPLPDGLINVILADPPYGIDYQSARRKDRSTRKPKIANDVTPYTIWLPEAFRVTSSPGALICFCRWDTAEIFRNSIEQAGFTIKSQVIWDREIHGMGDLKGAFAPCHDTIWFAVKGRFMFPGSRPKSVIREKRLGGCELDHPNQKPVGLYTQLISALCPEQGIILDPFVGSGASAEAARNLGRYFIGCDIAMQWAQFAQRRIEAIP